ncbi:pyridoxamine 5'-phosphate oxidase [uncultured Shewanella sp.]|uniref:pyridoxamine 5'-phosphate oxidase n=1 Tax=uncultured Shewanella sp. TaxID=173975 RepID=UPI00260D8B98|nr:pyridoxamine 5'-phosphate oxidase [uncultured Shewanella sp.]
MNRIIMKINPIEKFQALYKVARADSTLQQKGAICISTLDSDGFPDSRFVDLKEVTAEGFVFCTDYESNKGKSISQNNKIGLTVWWEHIETQIRIKGKVSKVNAEQSQQYWLSRSRSAQLTTWASNQSQPLSHSVSLTNNLAKYSKEFETVEVPKPPMWGGYLIRPIHFEFLTFRQDRMHIREVITLIDEQWHKSFLQP